jgi:acylphosphatase
MDDREVHIRVSGMVQGVGFRYFVYRKAAGMGLTGFVRNLAGGDVEIRARGPGGLLEDLLTAVKIGPRGSEVTRVFTEWVTGPEEYKCFEIR